MSLALWNRAGPAIHVPRGVQRPRWPFTLNKDSPQADGLIAWYPGWAGAGTTLFPYGGLRENPNGTLTGSIAWGVDPAGLMGNVLEVPGGATAHYIALPFMLNPNDGPASAFIWAYSRDWPDAGAVFHTLFQQEGSLGRAWLQIDEVGGGVIKLQSNIGNTLTPGATDLAPRLNEWIHYGVTWSSGGSGTLNVYIDGVSDASSTRDPESETSGYRYGAHKNPSANNRSWDGFMSDLRLYNKECPGSAVRQMWSPSSRWDMYYELNRIYYSFPIAVAAPVVDTFIPAGGHIGTS